MVRGWRHAHSVSPTALPLLSSPSRHPPTHPCGCTASHRRYTAESGGRYSIPSTPAKRARSAGVKRWLTAAGSRAPRAVPPGERVGGAGAGRRPVRPPPMARCACVLDGWNAGRCEKEERSEKKVRARAAARKHPPSPMQNSPSTPPPAPTRRPPLRGGHPPRHRLGPARPRPLRQRPRRMRRRSGGHEHRRRRVGRAHLRRPTRGVCASRTGLGRRRRRPRRDPWRVGWGGRPYLKGRGWARKRGRFPSLDRHSAACAGGQSLSLFSFFFNGRPPRSLGRPGPGPRPGDGRHLCPAIPCPPGAGAGAEGEDKKRGEREGAWERDAAGPPQPTPSPSRTLSSILPSLRSSSPPPPTRPPTMRQR
jgi:hypothetical protein